MTKKQEFLELLHAAKFYKEYMHHEPHVPIDGDRALCVPTFHQQWIEAREESNRIVDKLWTKYMEEDND